LDYLPNFGYCSGVKNYTEAFLALYWLSFGHNNNSCCDIYDTASFLGNREGVFLSNGNDFEHHPHVITDILFISAYPRSAMYLT
jgi:hypothetical protein